MKTKTFIAGVLCGIALLCSIAAVVKQSTGIYIIGGEPNEAKFIVRQDGQTQPWLQFNTSTNTVFQISSNGVISTGTLLGGITTNVNAFDGAATNQMRFLNGVLTNVVAL